MAYRKTYRIRGRGRLTIFVCAACAYEIAIAQFAAIPVVGANRLLFAGCPRTQAAAAMKLHVEREHRKWGSV